MIDLRTILAQMFGMGNKKINVDLECDYPATITVEDYHRMVTRGGVAARVNRIFPEACFEQDPQIYETEDVEATTPFEKSLEQLDKDFGIYALLEQADIDAGIGNYGVILVGIDDGLELSEPVKGITGKSTDRAFRENKVLYLRSFPMKYAKILDYETNKSNHRYGWPIMYQIEMDVVEQLAGAGSTASTKGYKVHWSRIVHICERPGKEMFHQPRCEEVYNHLLDLRKNYGGSAQMTWQGGFPGIAFEPANKDKDVEYELDPEAIKESMDRYNRGLQRYLAVEGFIPKTLPVQVYDPTAPIEVQLKGIACIKGVPYRIFIGTEEAQLAGSQDQKNWNNRIARRQVRIVTPRIVRPFVDLLISLKCLDEPTQDYTVKWPDRNEATREQKVKTGAEETKALALYQSSGVEELIPLAEFLTLFLGREQKEVEKILEERKKQEAELEAAREEDIANGIDPNTGLPIPDPEDEDPGTGPIPGKKPTPGGKPPMVAAKKVG